MSANNENRRPRPRMGGMGHGGRVAEKPKNFKSAMAKLVGYCKPFAVVIIIALVCDMLGVVFRLMGPDQLRKITNILTEGLMGSIDMDGIMSVIKLLIILYVAGSVLSFVTGIIMTIVTQKVNRGLRDSISKKINRLPVSYFHKTSTGDVLSRVTNDVDMIGQTLHQSISSLISAITMFIGSIIMMTYTNWIMSIVAILSSIIGFVFMGQIMSRTQKFFAARQKWLGEMNGHVEEIYTGQKIVKLFNAEDKEKAKFDFINDKMRENNWKSQFLSGLMQPLMGFVGNFGYVAVCVTGALLTMKGKTDFGVIVAFMVYIRQFTAPLSQLAQAATTLQSTAAASERVFEFLEADEMEDESGKSHVLTNVRGEVEFEHVRFGYTEDKEIIHDFSEHILPGQKVAIVGPTGAGKTTMVNLLMRFYEINSGAIKIDGVNTSEMTREEVHDLFGMVLQDTWLFEGTIRDNLAYGKTGISDEDLLKACKEVGLGHFIHSLPEGLDTVLDDSVNLSAGQKQLMTIARAMIENAPMLILDEATSSVDTRTELQIQRAMEALTVGRTSFVIAHRLSTIKNSDKILVMREGDIVESGTHDELLALNGFYAQLYNSQFEVA
ncbi:MAG: ABC transporter ATP-binding protein/permease [Saccharofermentans sp.]|nr:ABC transporter ATP-binding protein/permease [Saccharofermentans sp.]